MFEFLKSPEVFGLVIQQKIVGFIVHQAHHFPRLVDDGHPLPPRQDRRKKTRYFDVLLLSELVWNRYRIVGNKFRTIVLRYFFVEEILQIIFIKV